MNTNNTMQHGQVKSNLSPKASLVNITPIKPRIVKRNVNNRFSSSVDNANKSSKLSISDPNMPPIPSTHTLKSSPKSTPTIQTNQKASKTKAIIDDFVNRIVETEADEIITTPISHKNTNSITNTSSLKKKKNTNGSDIYCNGDNNEIHVLDNVRKIISENNEIGDFSSSSTRKMVKFCDSPSVSEKSSNKMMNLNDEGLINDYATPERVSSLSKFQSKNELSNNKDHDTLRRNSTEMSIRYEDTPQALKIFKDTKLTFFKYNDTHVLTDVFSKLDTKNEITKDEGIKDTQPMLVRVNLNSHIIQPTYMQEGGSMCFTELWTKKAKKNYYIMTKKSAKILRFNHLRNSVKEIDGVFKPEKINKIKEVIDKIQEIQGGYDYARKDYNYQSLLPPMNIRYNPEEDYKKVKDILEKKCLDEPIGSQSTLKEIKVISDIMGVKTTQNSARNSIVSLLESNNTSITKPSYRKRRSIQQIDSLIDYSTNKPNQQYNRHQYKANALDSNRQNDKEIELLTEGMQVIPEVNNTNGDMTKSMEIRTMESPRDEANGNNLNENDELGNKQNDNVDNSNKKGGNSLSKEQQKAINAGLSVRISRMLANYATKVPSLPKINLYRNSSDKSGIKTKQYYDGGGIASQVKRKGDKGNEDGNMLDMDDEGDGDGSGGVVKVDKKRMSMDYVKLPKINGKCEENEEKVNNESPLTNPSKKKEKNPVIESIKEQGLRFDNLDEKNNNNSNTRDTEERDIENNNNNNDKQRFEEEIREKVNIYLRYRNKRKLNYKLD